MIKDYVEKILSRIALDLGVSEETLHKCTLQMNEYEYEIVGQHLRSLADKTLQTVENIKPVASIRELRAKEDGA